MTRGIVLGSGLIVGLMLSLAPATRADDLSAKVKESVDRGLKWFAETQSRDGHWEANGGQYPTSMTALAAMTMLMEGSTLREGKYSDNLRRAVDWLMERTQNNGLIGNPNNPTEAARYMYGHGFGLLFLSCVYGEEEDGDRRKKLEQKLTKAVEFTGKAQTDRGGWGYLSAADGANFDEGSVTITQLQGLRAARNAGIVVPKSIIDKSVKYLKDSTTPRGGVIYSLAHGGAAAGGERAPLTAAAIACGFSAGDYDSELPKKWIEFCRTAIPVGRRTGQHDEYMHYYYAQAMYVLGENRYAQMFPKVPKEDRLTWSKYKVAMFEQILTSQNRDGSWSGGYVGPPMATSMYLTILQLENGNLPIYQR